MSYIYLQEQAEESSAESYSDIPAYVLSRLNLIAEKSFYKDKETECCQSSQSGTMCEPSTVIRGEGKLTSSVEDSLAKTYLAQEKERELKESEADCGLNLQESLAKYDPATHLWRTRQCSLFEDSGECLETFPKSGMMQGGVLWELMTLEHRTSEKECGFWRTPDTGAGGDSFGQGIGGTCERKLEKTEWQSETVEVARPSARTEIVSDTELFGNGRWEQFEKSQQKEGNPSDALPDANLSRCKSEYFFEAKSSKRIGRSCTWWDRDPADQDGAFESQLGRVADGVANRVDRLKAIGNGQVPLVAATAFRILMDRI